MRLLKAILLAVLCLLCWEFGRRYGVKVAVKQEQAQYELSNDDEVALELFDNSYTGP